jgi:hypothetical protein
MELSVTNLHLMEEVLDILFGVNKNAMMKIRMVAKSMVSYTILNVKLDSTMLAAAFALLTVPQAKLTSEFPVPKNHMAEALELLLPARMENNMTLVSVTRPVQKDTIM